MSKHLFGVLVMLLLLVGCGSGGSGPLSSGTGDTVPGSGIGDGSATGPGGSGAVLTTSLDVVVDISSLNAESVGTEWVDMVLMNSAPSGIYVDYKRPVSETVFSALDGTLSARFDDVAQGTYRLKAFITWREVGASEPSASEFYWDDVIAVPGGSAVRLTVTL